MTMLKRLVLTFSFGALAALSMAGQPNKSGNNKNPPANRDQPSTVTYTFDANCCTQQEPPKANDESFHWSKALSKPDWWLFLATVATLGVISYQTMQTKRAADAAKNSADAALLNARAVINAERAWISVTPHKETPKFYAVRDKNSPIPENLVEVLPIAHLFAGKLLNVGKTPAKIEGAAVRYVRTPIHPSKWDANPDYGDIAKGVRFAFPDEDDSISAELYPTATLTQAQIDAVQDRKEFLFAFGIVQYRDVYDTLHETRFGYVYEPQDSHLVMKDGVIETIRTGEARFRLGGPAKYNEHT
jgi:hypothetical protein